MNAESQHHFLTDFQKRQIDALRVHLSHHEIALQLGIPRRTVSGFIERLETRYSYENLPRPGRRRKTTAADDRYIIRTAEIESRILLTELKEHVNLPISERTIQRRLRRRRHSEMEGFEAAITK